jgi:hypothetical protein
MMKARAIRLALTVAALAAFAESLGAGAKWR